MYDKAEEFMANDRIHEEDYEEEELEEGEEEEGQLERPRRRQGGAMPADAFGLDAKFAPFA